MEKLKNSKGLCSTDVLLLTLPDLCCSRQGVQTHVQNRAQQTLRARSQAALWKAKHFPENTELGKPVPGTCVPHTYRLKLLCTRKGPVISWTKLSELETSSPTSTLGKVLATCGVQ